MEGLDAVERSGVAIKMNVYVDHAVQCPPRSSDDVVKATEQFLDFPDSKRCSKKLCYVMTGHNEKTNSRLRRKHYDVDFSLPLGCSVKASWMEVSGLTRNTAPEKYNELRNKYR